MKRRVLFLCTGNSARSQMAEGLLRHLAGDAFEVASAGTHPVGLNLLAVRAMQEVAIDISNHRSKSTNEYLNQHFDYVITVCDRAKETCPLFPGASSTLHWSIDDPAGAQGSIEFRQAAFRRVRDEITKWVHRFMQEEA